MATLFRVCPEARGLSQQQQAQRRPVGSCARERCGRRQAHNGEIRERERELGKEREMEEMLWVSVEVLVE